MKGRKGKGRAEGVKIRLIGSSSSAARRVTGLGGVGSGRERGACSVEKREGGKEGVRRESLG